MDLNTEHITTHRAHLSGADNDLSARYLRMLERWLPVGVELFNEWPQRPRAGHFLSGAHWYGLETVGPAFALAVAASAPDLDTATAGVSRDQLREMALAAVRYLCFTHDTGPADCVRPDHGLGDPRNFGTKWGERGTTYFKESQCGRTTAPLVAACLLLGDIVDDETRQMVGAMQADYLERFSTMPPRNGIYIDTQMEENGWTAEGLTGAHLFLENHPQAQEWDAHCRGWMFSTCATPQDAKNLAAMGDTTVAAHTAKIVTTLPDYWAENHGMVHPSYTAAGVKFTVYIGNLLGLWGRDVPPQLLWNRDRVYQNLKVATDDGGYVQPIQGMDWPYLSPVGNEMIHAVASVLFDDPEAAALQRRGLRMAELRQQGNGGRLVNAEVADRAREKDRATVLREAGIAEVAHLYLFHRLFGAGANPVPEAELSTRLAGVRHYPHAGFIHHRHTQGQTSLSWRNVIMALPLTQEGIYTIAPARDTWLAQPVVADEPDCQDLQRLHVIEREDAFAVAMSIDRCQGSLQQQVLFASLPDGRALSYERLLATRDCRLESLEQGFIRITNETFPLLDNGCRGERVLYGESGDTTYRGWIGDDPSDDIVDELRGPSWLNIDDRLGIRCAGSGTGQYRNRHHYEAYQVIADDLVISSEKPRALYQGDTAGVLAALVCPGQRHGATATAVFQLIEAEDSIALLTDDALTATNFGEETVDVLFPLSMSQSAESGSAESGSSIFESVPVFAGMTTVVASDLSLHVELRPGHPVLSRLVVTATVAGSCRLEATGNGIYATASTDCDLSLSDDTRHLAAGESTLFEIPTARKSHP